MEYKEFLKTTLPLMGLRWRRFNRASIRKRVIDRMQQLNLQTWSDYKNHLLENEEERHLLTSMLTVTISRFWRNSSLFDRLEKMWLPALLEAVAPEETVQIWSAGCASGEEPYSLLILWQESFANSGRRLRLLASDSDSHCLKRARQARYPASSFREMPLQLRQKYFTNEKGTFSLRHNLSQNIEWFEHNLIWEPPPMNNNLIFCRNLVYTYFTDSIQEEISRRFHQALVVGGFLIVGRKDRLPHGTEGLFRLMEHPIYQKVNVAETI
jgi:chemotaxis protein methyltransferase CheR